jgi:hypothetical protein
LQHLYGIAAITGLSGAGFLPEYLSGDRAQALPRSVPHQLFSSGAVVHPLVSGLLGLEGNALDRTLTIAPHLPGAWKEVRFEKYTVGKSRVKGRIVREEGRIRAEVQIEGDPLRVRFSPALPLAARTTLRTERSIYDQHVTVESSPRNGAVVLEVTYSGGEEPMPELVIPQPGDRSRAKRW